MEMDTLNRPKAREIIENYLPSGFDSQEVLSALHLVDLDGNAPNHSAWRRFRFAIKEIEDWFREHGTPQEAYIAGNYTCPEFPSRDLVGAMWALQGNAKKKATFSEYYQSSLSRIGLGELPGGDGSRFYDFSWPSVILYRWDPTALYFTDWKARFLGEGWVWDEAKHEMKPPKDFPAAIVQLREDRCRLGPREYHALFICS